MKQTKLLLPLDIQFFAGDGEETQTEETQQEETQTEETEQQEETKTYTQDEVNDIVKQRLAREKKAADEAIKEAEKLAKMNEQQKQEYEFEKLRNENEALKKAQNRYELGAEATRMLAAANIKASEEVLSFVVRDSAEDTSEAVQAFSALVDSLAEERMVEKLKGKSPRTQTGTVSAMTKAEIMQEKDTVKRQKLIKENIHLFQ